MDALVHGMGTPIAPDRQTSHQSNEPTRPYFLDPPAHSGWLGRFAGFDVVDQLGRGGDGYVFRCA